MHNSPKEHSSQLLQIVETWNQALHIEVLGYQLSSLKFTIKSAYIYS